jgi:sterol desaturase/sphingolipid hydroxylase (fatty acid hydroxylase superfamily)
MHAGLLVLGIWGAVLWILESAAPYYAQFPGGTGSKVRHDLRNAVIGALNAILLFAFTIWVGERVMGCGDGPAFGLLCRLSWPPWMETVAALVLFDLWMYVWHRLNHAVPFLWRFHRMHHSDPEMDASTAVRFHPGEILISAAARIPILLLLGMEIWQFVLYETLLLPVILLHHSNVSLPRILDRGLLALIVTPAMHRVHHSRIRVETDSNYGSVLPYWDLVFRSFRLRKDARGIELGLDEFASNEWQTLAGMLRTPVWRGRTPELPQ